MELQSKEMVSDPNEPFEIVYNARKNSKNIKSTASKTRKDSTISLVDEKQKKIKKKVRKFTQYLKEEDKWFEEARQTSEKGSKRQNSLLQGSNLEQALQYKSTKQKQRGERQEIVLDQKQHQDFCFMDHEGEKGILDGIGDENSLGRQFNFDYFNPEKYSR